MKILSSKSFTNIPTHIEDEGEDCKILLKLAALQCQKDDTVMACSSWNNLDGSSKDSLKVMKSIDSEIKGNIISKSPIHMLSDNSGQSICDGSEIPNSKILHNE